MKIKSGLWEATKNISSGNSCFIKIKDNHGVYVDINYFKGEIAYPLTSQTMWYVNPSTLDSCTHIAPLNLLSWK